MENSMKFPKKIKNRTTIWSSNLILGIHPKGVNQDLKEVSTLSCSFTTAKIWKQCKCPLMDGWIKKMWCIYKVEYYSVFKKKEILPYATNMAEPRTHNAKPLYIQTMPFTRHSNLTTVKILSHFSFFIC